MRFTYARPKPRPSLEIALGRFPRYAELAIMLLIMIVLIWSVAWYAKANLNALRIPKLPKVPNVSAAINRSVDDAVRKVTKP